MATMLPPPPSAHTRQHHGDNNGNANGVDDDLFDLAGGSLEGKVAAHEGGGEPPADNNRRGSGADTRRRGSGADSVMIGTRFLRDLFFDTDHATVHHHATR